MRGKWRKARGSHSRRVIHQRIEEDGEDGGDGGDGEDCEDDKRGAAEK
jgi:hypothetical protein